MDKHKPKVRVFGAGFVGFANGLVYAKKYQVEFVDFNEQKVHLINSGEAPIEDNEALAVSKDLWNRLSATDKFPDDWADCRLVIVAVPTDYDEVTRKFNVETLETTLHQIRLHDENVPIIIKSTLPVGFTAACEAKNGYSNIFFSPEFLQEGRAIKDAQSPTRIILSPQNELAITLIDDVKHLTNSEASKCILMTTTEAESVKLFANGYLAMRVAFFNELDTFCMERDLSSESIIRGISLDPRIGMHYNNPSFGFGGYCFPKDTNQLREQVYHTGSKIISNIPESNDVRIAYLAKYIFQKYGNKIGVYKLSMKSGTQNARSSAMIKVIEKLADCGCSILVYDPENTKIEFESTNVTHTTSVFELDKESDVILLNRITDDPQIKEFVSPTFTRDIFHRD